MEQRGWLARNRTLILSIVIALGAAAYFFGAQVLRIAYFYSITPSGPFEDYQIPPKPDYSLPAAWAAHPDINDPADVAPEGMSVMPPALAKADVFFIHPTTFLSSDGWNQTLNGAEPDDILEKFILPSQAGAFNGCCRVFAPHYRQATLAAFIDEKGNREKALGLAYTDVLRAFEYFLSSQNEGRPFLLVGHSQGALHAQSLLQTAMPEDVLQDQLIAAYTIGQPIPETNLLPPCATSAQTGCQIGWNSQMKNARVSIGRPDSLCVNPLTWTTTSEVAPASLNTGAVDYAGDGVLETGVADAQCKDGQLLLTEVNSENFQRMPFGPGNYHIYEFSLYYSAIRENAQTRVDAWLSR